MTDLPETTPALIVGAGPIGLSCAISARRRDIDARVIDAGPIAHAISRYPIGMTFFTTPERLEIGNHPLTCAGQKATREEALAYYRGVARAESLRIAPYCRLVGAERMGDEFRCQVTTRLGPRTVRTPRLVLATGYLDHPNLLDVPGEELPHVRHWFDEPHLTTGQDVVIIGAKNSAIEAALLSFRAGARVSVVHRGSALKETVKYWLRPDFENRVAAGEIAAHFNSTVERITPAVVTIRRADGGTLDLPADRVYPLIGYHPDFDLLRALGIELDPTTRRAAVDPDTLETNVPGLHLAGSVASGTRISEVFIENGRFDGEKIFGDTASRRAAERRYAEALRPTGE
jgi:thioredoxin reductase (NADPH)